MWSKIGLSSIAYQKQNWKRCLTTDVGTTLQEINISHLGKRNIFKMDFSGDMLVPRRVTIFTIPSSHINSSHIYFNQNHGFSRIPSDFSQLFVFQTKKWFKFNSLKFKWRSCIPTPPQKKNPTPFGSRKFRTRCSTNKWSTKEPWTLQVHLGWVVAAGWPGWFFGLPY